MKRWIGILVSAALASSTMIALSGPAAAAARQGDWGIVHGLGDRTFKDNYGYVIRGLTIRSGSDVDFVGVDKATVTVTATGGGKTYSLPSTLKLGVDGTDANAFQGPIIQANTYFGLSQHTDNLGNVWHERDELPNGKYLITLKLDVPGHWSCPQYDPKGCTWWDRTQVERRFDLVINHAADTSAQALRYSHTATVSVTESSGKVSASHTATFKAKSTQKATVKKTVKKNKRKFSAKRSAKATATHTVKKTATVRDYEATASATRTASGTGWTPELAKNDAASNARYAAEAAAYALAKKNAPKEAKAKAKQLAEKKLTKSVKKKANAQAKKKAKAAAKKKATKSALKAANAKAKKAQKR